MGKQITGKKFALNVVISLSVQIVSLIVNFILQLVVPGLIDELQYAYWQVFVMYTGYVGVLHFGLLDGLVLRYSKYDYGELDKRVFRSQFLILLSFTSICTLAISSVSLIFAGGAYKLIFIYVAIGIVTKNIFTYSSYLLQITNRISKYAILVITQKVVYGLCVVLLLILKVDNFSWYCLADLAGDIVAITVGGFFNRGLYLGRALPIKKAFKELGVNVGAGIILMMANWSSSLMVGSAKMSIQWRWDELLFGKISFAFSLSNVFLIFITAISVVLFPSLKRIDEDKLSEMYKSIRDILSPFMFFIMIMYFFGSWILQKWLPNYAISLSYLAVLLPLIIFSSKTSLLTNNYLKVYRKEKIMLAVNAISLALGVVLFALSAYVFNNVYVLLCCVVVVIMFNSIVSEIVVMRIIRVKFIKEFIIEAIMTVGFILCATLLGLWIGCLAYVGLFAVYAIINYRSIKALFKRVFKKKSIASTETKEAFVEDSPEQPDESIGISDDTDTNTPNLEEKL